VAATIARIGCELTTAMFGVLVKMNVAQIHLSVRGGRIELTQIGTCRILKIPRRLRPEALIPGVFGERLMLGIDDAVGNVPAVQLGMGCAGSGEQKCGKCSAGQQTHDGLLVVKYREEDSQVH